MLKAVFCFLCGIIFIYIYRKIYLYNSINIYFLLSPGSPHDYYAGWHYHIRRPPESGAFLFYCVLLRMLFIIVSRRILPSLIYLYKSIKIYLYLIMSLLRILISFWDDAAFHPIVACIVYIYRNIYLYILYV